MSLRKKIVGGVAAAGVATGLVIAGGAPASADPISDLGAGGYRLLFDAGVAVYEVSSVENFYAMTTDIRHGSDRWLKLDRVPNAQAGKPGTVKYAIAGAHLPDTFYLDANGNDLVRTNPRPSQLTEQMVDMDKPGQRVMKIGPVAIAGVPGPIGGAIAR